MALKFSYLAVSYVASLRSGRAPMQCANPRPQWSPGSARHGALAVPLPRMGSPCRLWPAGQSSPSTTLGERRLAYRRGGALDEQARIFDPREGMTCSPIRYDRAIGVTQSMMAPPSASRLTHSKSCCVIRICKPANRHRCTGPAIHSPALYPNAKGCVRRCWAPPMAASKTINGLRRFTEIIPNQKDQ